MIGAEAALIALVAGAVSGGVVGGVVAAFSEAYFGRRAQEQVGAYDAPVEEEYRH